MTPWYLAVAVRIDPHGRPRVIDRRKEVLREVNRAKMAAMDLMYRMGGKRVCGAWEVTAEGMRDVHAASADVSSKEAVSYQHLLLDEAGIYAAEIRKSIEDEQKRTAKPATPETQAMANALTYEREQREVSEWAAATLRQVREEVGDVNYRHDEPWGTIASSTAGAATQAATAWLDNYRAAEAMGFNAGSRATGGTGVRVALIGTGCDGGYRERTPGALGVIDWSGLGERDRDSHGWGTHGTSVLLGWDNVEHDTRVVGGVEVVPVKVCDPLDGHCPDRWLACAIGTARRLGCQVAVVGCTSEWEMTKSAEAIRQATQAGVLVIAPAGDSQTPGGSARWPATMPEVLAVGAASEKGEPEWWSCSPGDVGVYAVGVDIWGAAGPDTICQSSGTAVAAVWAAAAAALVYERWRAVYGEWPSPVNVAAMLQAHQTIVTGESEVTFSGPGLLNVDGVLKQFEAWPKEQGPPKPAPPPPDLLPTPLEVEYYDTPDDIMKMLAELCTILREHRAVTIRFKPTHNDYKDGPPIN